MERKRERLGLQQVCREIIHQILTNYYVDTIAKETDIEKGAIERLGYDIEYTFTEEDYEKLAILRYKIKKNNPEIILIAEEQLNKLKLHLELGEFSEDELKQVAQKTGLKYHYLYTITTIYPKMRVTDENYEILKAAIQEVKGERG